MQTPRNTLRQRDFIIVLLGQVISLFGNAILRFALPLHLLRATGSAALFGSVSALSFAPMVVLSLLGGVLADRVDKRNVMVALDAIVALLCGAFLLVMDELSIAAATAVFLMLLYGASGLYQPAVQASMPALLCGEALLRGNAAVNMVSTLDDLLGPALGGILFGLWGLEPVLAVSGLCFAASAVMEMALNIPREKRPRDGGMCVTAWRDLAESWRYLCRARGALLRLTFLLALFNFALSAALIVGVPVLAVGHLGLSDSAVGATQAAMGLGGLCGGLLAGVWAGKLRLRHGFFPLLACAPAMLLVGASALPGLGASGWPLLLAGCFCAMAAASLFSVHISAVVQARTPAFLVGKVMSLMMAVAMCMQPLGQLLYGMLFEALGPGAFLAMLFAAFAAALLAFCARGTLRRMEGEGRSAAVAP